jgi:cytochrome d ubiquinol oxidase subunit II
VSLVDVVGAILFVGVVAYAVFGGADFGTGFWDLTAGDSRRGGPLRSLIDHSLGPVWEANHVWLIFVLVYLWTGFPTAFAAMSTTLQVPLAAAALGIVLRGAGFAFRKFSSSIPAARAFGAIFALSSIITPFFLGAVSGAVAAGRVPADGSGDRWTSWTGPTSLLGGALAVLTCAYLAGVFLVADASRTNQVALVEGLRRKVVGVGIVTGAVVIGGALPLRSDATVLYDRLSGRGVVVVVLSALAGSASVVLLLARRDSQARLAATAAVVAVLIGWGFAQYPWVLVDELQLEDAAGARPTLIGLVVVGGLATVMVVPSLVWLFRLVHQDSWSEPPPDARRAGGW